MHASSPAIRAFTRSGSLNRFAIALMLSCPLLLTACDPGDLETPATSTLVDLRDNSTGKVELEILELLRPRDGQDAELVLQYTLTGIDPASLPPDASLIITIVDDSGLPLVTTDSIPLESQIESGEVVVVVPANETSQVTAVAAVQVEGETGDTEISEETHAVLGIDLSNSVRATDLGLVRDFSSELVRGSYDSQIVASRRLHRFAVRVYDQECVSIRGLDEDVGKFFTLLEDSFADSESPVTYDSRNNFINVYFVLDASSSITPSDQVQILSAARYASDRLRDDYVVDFRQFSGDIARLNSFRDYRPDVGQSATAFYYAIDTVLEEIDARGANEDYNVIIGFTDGIDLASRNHFGLAFSHDDVKRLVRDKVAQFRSSPGLQRGSGLELHVLSVGDVESERGNLTALAAAGGGQHVFAADSSSLEPLLESLVNRVLSTYHLQYSSQQIASDTSLELDIDINGIEKPPLTIQFAGGLRPPEEEHFCRQR